MSAGGMLLGLAMAGLNSIVCENNEFQNTSTTRRFSNPLSLAAMYNVAVKHVKSVQRRIDVIRLTGSVDTKLVDYALQVYKDPAFQEKVLITVQLFVHFPVSYCVLKVALLQMAVIDHHYAEMAAEEAVQSGDSTHVKMKQRVALSVVSDLPVVLSAGANQDVPRLVRKLCANDGYTVKVASGCKLHL